MCILPWGPCPPVHCTLTPWSCAQAPQSQSSTLQPSSAHLVRLCAALVVFAAPGLLAQPLARAAVGEAAKHGCPIHIIAPASMSSLNALLGDAGQGQRQEAGVKDEDLDPALGLLSDQVRVVRRCRTSSSSYCRGPGCRC